MLSSRSDGLVHCRKTDRNVVDNPVTIQVFSDIVEIKVHQDRLPGDEVRRLRGGGKRGRITEFSASSRNNMMRKLARLRSVDKAMFVTLTYPDEFPEEAEEWKRHLSVLRKRLMRRFPGIAAIWRLEKKPRLSGRNKGQVAPHFHLLVLGVHISHLMFRAWIRAAWYGIAHNGDKYLGLAAVQVDPIRSRRHACYYVSKYLGKANDDESLTDTGRSRYTGRYWGVFGDMDMAVIVVMSITLDVLVKLKRLLRGWLHSHKSGYEKVVAHLDRLVGCSVFRMGIYSQGDLESVVDAPIIRMVYAAMEE